MMRQVVVLMVAIAAVGSAGCGGNVADSELAVTSEELRSGRGEARWPMD